MMLSIFPVPMLVYTRFGPKIFSIPTIPLVAFGLLK